MRSMVSTSYNSKRKLLKADYEEIINIKKKSRNHMRSMSIPKIMSKPELRFKSHEMIVKNILRIVEGDGRENKLNEIINLINLNLDNLRSKDSDGDTIVHHLLKNRLLENSLKSDLLQLLSFFPDSCKQNNFNGMLPLHIACYHCSENYQIIDLIIRAYPNAIYLPMRKKSELSGYLPLHILVARSPSIASVKLLVDKYPDALSMGDNNGSTPLSIALRNRAPLHIVQYLLNRNKSTVLLADKRFNIPLHIACSWELYSLDVIFLLVELCYDSLFFKNINGKTPLDLARTISVQSSVHDKAIDYLINASSIKWMINSTDEELIFQRFR